MRLVGLYTYCRMMHGAYNVKPSILFYKNVKLTLAKFEVPREVIVKVKVFVMLRRVDWSTFRRSLVSLSLQSKIPNSTSTVES